MKKYLLSLFLSLPFCLGISAVQADDEKEIIKDALQGYLDFADYGDGVIPASVLDQQLDQVFIIDTRRKADFDQDHLPGARHIEWREVIQHLDELPKEQKIVVYCDTGVLSSKVHLMLRLLGYENARVLFGGYLQWRVYQNEKNGKK